MATIESRLPLEFPCFGPSPEAVRAVVSSLLRALPADLRIGCVTDPNGPNGPNGPGDFGDFGRGASSYASTAASASLPANRIILSAPPWNSDSWRAALADCDLALTEGRPKPGYPGILILPEGTNASLSEAASDSSLFACVASFPNPSSLPKGISVFSPDRLSALAELMVERAKEVLLATPLYGMVLGGGRSSRMRTDKASLAYHGKPQT
ncbi:MAG: hypothetical protein M3Y08_18710, partial [Fibrobacterota bacterium]|nr:hypothetical protein [Fibrobacterota bacterium]